MKRKNAGAAGSSWGPGREGDPGRAGRNPVQPPRWASRFLGWYCRPELLEDLQGDLYEFFGRNVEKRGVFIARLIYILDVLKFFRSYTVRKPTMGRPLN